MLSVSQSLPSAGRVWSFILYRTCTCSSLSFFHELNDSKMPPHTTGDQHNTHSSTTVNSDVPPRRSSRKGPKPWYILKLSVGFSAGIIAYSSYVYIGRLCIPMIKRERNSLGSRTLGSECRCPPNPCFLPVCVDVRTLTTSFTFFFTFHFLGVGIFGSRILGCVCRARDDDGMGVYQGARLSASHALHPSLILEMSLSVR